MKLKNSSLSHIGCLAIISILLTGWFSTGCQKEVFNTDTNFSLQFSSDTVLFDTIFTSIGSTTRQFVIRNTSNKRVNISSISLAGGTQSSFRINVDGKSGFSFQNVEIGANDSAYVFVKVTVDPNEQSLPLIKSDSVLFTLNGNKQKVMLVAWGQNAYFYNNATLKGTINFESDKPHVIYGNLLIDTSAVLNIAEGAQLCFHKNAYLILHKDARIVATGSFAKPIIFRGDASAVYRPDKDTIPGQWGGIILKALSGKHTFTYCNILNSRVAIETDSCIQPDAITLYNCKISNMVNYGLKLKNTNVIAANCEISNCGAYLLSLTGCTGSDFRHCTFANYWPFTARKTVSVLLSNYDYIGSLKVVHPIQDVYFGNCIINSYSKNELQLKRDESIAFGLQFERCLISSDTIGTKPTYFVNCDFNKEIKFKDVQKLNFQLDTLSAAKDYGNISVISTSFLNLTNDLKGNPRTIDAGPDAGAYERKEIQ